jgi:outer membrane cobalamin receptor
MRTLLATAVVSLIVSSALASKPVDPQTDERTVFVTGSLIPQRINLKPIGTTTVSPIRIIDRQEIDQSGRRTTPGALVADPSVRVVGH